MNQPQVGDMITQYNATDATPGTVVESGTTTAVRTYTGWITNRPTVVPTVYFARQYQNMPVVEVGTMQEDNFQRYAQRLRSVCLGRGEAHGITRAHIERILEAANVPTYEPFVGMYVDFGDVTLNGRIPEGAIGISGPDRWDFHGIWRKGPYNDWAWMSGGHQTEEGVTIVELPGDHQAYDWHTADPTDDDRTRIAQLMATMKRLGAEGKSRHGWCGSYESVMERINIERPTPPDTPTTVTTTGETMPDGWVPTNVQFRVGDRITRRNRPHTSAGYGDYAEAVIGEVGTINRQDHGPTRYPQLGHNWNVTWDSGRGSNIDGQCIMLADQQFFVGARVTRAYGQRLTFQGNEDGGLYDEQAAVGAVGTVTLVLDDMVRVDWDGGRGGLDYDQSCLEVLSRPEERGAAMHFLPGQRVRMIRPYTINGVRRQMHDRNGQPGDTAVVELVYDNGDGTMDVRWENPRGAQANRIDMACFEAHSDTPVTIAEDDRPLRRGDRVTLAYEYRSSGRRPSSARAQRVRIGQGGRIESAIAHNGTVTVNWDGDPNGALRIDRHCLTREVANSELGEPAAPLRGWMIGDRVRLVTPYTWRNGTLRPSDDMGNRPIAEVGEAGTISQVQLTTRNSEHMVEVRWDRIGRGRFVDRACLRYIGDDPIEEVTVEPAEGRRVRLTSRFSWQGRSSDTWDTRFGVIGDIGIINSVAGDEEWRVRWPNGADPDFNSHVDPGCLEVLPDGEVEVAPRPWQVRDRVALVGPYTRAGEPYNPDRNPDGIATLGDLGRIINPDPPHDDGHLYVEVIWDNRRTGSRYIDKSSLRLIAEDRQPQPGDRVMLTGPYTYRERHDTAWDERYGVKGGTGTVVERENNRPRCQVQWDQGTSGAPSYVDDSCLAVFA